MKINLNLLPYELDEKVSFPESFYEKTDIVNLKDVYVKGKIFYNLTDEVALDIDVNGIMVLKDSITNKEVDYPFSFKIDDVLSNFEGESEKYFEKSKNLLDIIEFLWENIVLEVPISFSKEKNVKLEGEGWKLNDEDANEDIDPRLAELSNLFKGGE